MRPGRRSGLLAPRIGFNQIFRQSPFLQRSIQDIGYYFALNDYVSTTVTMDWSSNARTQNNSPGFVQLNSTFDYVWKDRFIDGKLGISTLYRRNGDRMNQYSFLHQQKFSERTALTANFNYTSNAKLQRQTTFNPQLALQTISSQATFRTGRGPFSFDLGATQKQYPGRDQLDRDFPSLRVSSKPIELGQWMSWTPSLTISNSQSLNIDQVGDFAFRYKQTATGIDSTERLKRNTRNSSVSFDTPVEIFGFSWRNAIRVTDVANDFPERRVIYPNPRDTSVRQDRVFARTYRTGLEWETSFSLPNFSQGKLNISPSVQFQKVDGRSPLIVRTERTGGKFVSQSFRPAVGVSMSPKIYGFFPGFGKIETIRHAIEPTLQWQYTPKGNVSDEFLAANGDVAVGFLGNLPQNALSLGFNTSFEAKLRAPDQPATAPARDTPADSLADSAAADTAQRRTQQQQQEGRKIKLLAMNFTTLSYDFVRARESSGGTGLTNRTFDWSARTDLLPGFEVGVNYSLFLGDPISDTAVFKPYREGVRASISLDQNSPIVQTLARFLGIRVADSASRARGAQRPGDESGAQGRQGTRAGSGELMAGRSIVGSARLATLSIPKGQGWRMNLSYNSNRQRPPTGTNIKEYDPKSQCELYRDDPLQYSLCLNQFAIGGNPTTGLPFNETTRGGTFFRMPPTSNITGQMSFNVTRLWAAQWQTSYDVVTGEFAQHVVSLQREMHDWDATFGFTRSPNGNFAFTFYIALRAQPDIKLDYDRASYPRGTTGRRQF
jgi:LptD protein